MITKGYGFTVDDIDWSCPADLEPYAKAHNIELKEKDNMMYAWYGEYALSACYVAIDRALHGKKSKAEYVKKTFMQMAEEDSQEMTEEKKKKMRELFVARLMAMSANFQLNKKSEDNQK